MSGHYRPEDLRVVIPTRDRWPILARTLDGLRHQSVTGFAVTVVVDGPTGAVPDLGSVDVLTQPHRGPGAARNAGARRSRQPLVLFLGDDMVPDPTLVAEHLAAHRRFASDADAVLGHVTWHPEVAGGRLQRWLERSASQFDFATISGGEAGFGHFYSCNVSLKRRFFLDAGGFDEAFTYYYEDLDCGYRLHQKGMRLHHVPGAGARHLHRYGPEGLRQRFAGIADGERLMARTHPWFEPFFLGRIRQALPQPAPSRLWPLVADRVPGRLPALAAVARSRADLWYHRWLAEPFLAGWASAEDLAELRSYLGDAFDEQRLFDHQQAVDAERVTADDEATFYRTSRSYLYDLTAFAMWGTKAPYLAELRAVVPPGARLLDYGCGIGADGLRLLADGYQVSFADFANPSTAFLRWRLAHRGIDAPVYDLDADDVPGGFHAAYAFDVIEHVEDPDGFLAGLERRADLVMVNLLDEDPHDTDLHRPLPVSRLLDRAERCGLIRYRRYHGRSHLLVYRSPAARRPPLARAGSLVQRRLGRHLPGRAGWYPVPVR